MSDPFDAKQQLSEYIVELAAAVRDESPETKAAKGYQLPFFVNSYAYELGHHWQKFENELMKTGFPNELRLSPEQTSAQREAKGRAELELARAKRVGLLMENLQEKYENALRTRAILSDVEQGRTPFILLLREFTFKTNYLQSGSRGSQAGFEERKNRIAYANELKGIPLLWVSNPSESGAFDTYSLSKVASKDDSYRLQVGEDWEPDVEKLIVAAAFIIVSNGEMTPGVTRELELLSKKNRIEDCFFSDPDKASQHFGTQSCHPLNDSSFEIMRKKAKAKALKPEELPQPTCLWLTDQSREMVEWGITGVQTFFSSLRQNIHYDIQLDALFGYLASAMVLELTNPLIEVLDRIASILAKIPPDDLKESQQFAAFYSGYADILFDASLDIFQSERLQQVEYNLLLFQGYHGAARNIAAAKNTHYVRNDTPQIPSESDIGESVYLSLEIFSNQSVDSCIDLCRDYLIQNKLNDQEKGVINGLLASCFFTKAFAIIQGKDVPTEEYPQKLLSSSIHHYSQAIALNPGQFLDHWNRGYCHELLNQTRLAIIDYTHSIRLKPSHAKAYLYRSRALTQIGKLQLAHEDNEIYKQLAS